MAKHYLLHHQYPSTLGISFYTENESVNKLCPMAGNLERDVRTPMMLNWGHVHLVGGNKATAM